MVTYFSPLCPGNLSDSEMSVLLEYEKHMCKDFQANAGLERTRKVIVRDSVGFNASLFCFVSASGSADLEVHSL